MRRGLVAIVLALVAVVVAAPAASAHPLGNAATNQYVGLRVQPDAINVDYVLDLAELPTYQTCQHEGCASATATTRCASATAKLRVTVGTRVGKLALRRAKLGLSKGVAGLSTLRLECQLGIATSLVGDTKIHVTNTAFPGTIGWREITATGERATLVSSDVSSRSTSHRLAAYPNDLLSSPPDQRTAALVARAGGSAPGRQGASFHLPGPQLRGMDRLSLAYTSFVADRRTSIGFMILAVLLSIGLGGLHALAPGHGKTMMAAYAVAARGSRRQMAAIGLTVAATHTVGVVGLGVLFTIAGAAPERIYPWLGGVSGLLLVAVGIGLLRSVLRHRHSHGHGHPHGHHHGHGHGYGYGHGHDCGHGHTHDHTHEHGHGHSHGPSRGRLVGMGIAGGLVPSPSALLVLLGGVALGRVWLGLVLVVAYGLGLAGTLCGIGLLLSRGWSVIERRTRDFPRIGRALPVLTSSLVLVVGIGTVAGAMSAL